MVPKGLAELLIVLRDQLRELSVNLQPAWQSQASVNHALSLSRTRNFETGKNTKFVFESYLKKKIQQTTPKRSTVQELSFERSH